jgi:hypothetical protein
MLFIRSPVLALKLRLELSRYFSVCYFDHNSSVSNLPILYHLSSKRVEITPFIPHSVSKMHRFKILILPFTFSIFTSIVVADLSASNTSSILVANLNSMDISTNHKPASITHHSSSILTRRNPDTRERMGGGLAQILHMILHSVLHVASHAMAHGLMHGHAHGHFPEHIFCDAEINCLRGMFTDLSYPYCRNTV